jgi:polyhydroxyalkanoate synthesis regulator phasin
MASESKGSQGRASRESADTDKSVKAFRDALEQSVTLSRDRIQEVVDDAVKRGRMTRADANDLVSSLVTRGRKQSDTLLKDLEKLLGQAARAARDVADRPLAEADRIRRRAGGPGFPISAYDQLTAVQVRKRLADLSKPELRKVRTREQQGKARKSVLSEIERRLAA